MTYKLGLLPPRPGAVKLRLATYVDYTKIPTPPKNFGHEALIGVWGMLGNDQYGDCAICGPAHQSMLWCKEAGVTANFTTESVLKDYTAIAGFDPNDPNTDQGTDIDTMASYWRKTGLTDADGKTHQIVAYLDLNPGDLRELWTACYLFQSVGMGFQMPQSALDQTAAGEPWMAVGDQNIVGGHYVPAFGRISGQGVGVTWGALQKFTASFYRMYSDQGIVALSEEMMTRAKSIDGFDDALLRADLPAITSLKLGDHENPYPYAPPIPPLTPPPIDWGGQGHLT